ncbi:uncharacterized protein [Rhodnius prolixus]|uniref:Salivary secreted protein n=1 Tax=Rhodnius prolixus TaxID=13249 RepID=T1H978_RHOPR
MKLLLMCLVFFCFVLVQDFFVFARPNPEETSSLWSFWPFSSGGSTTVANEPAAIAPEEAKNDRNSLYRLVQTALEYLATAPVLGDLGLNLAGGISINRFTAIFTYHQLKLEEVRMLAAKSLEIVSSIAVTTYQLGQQVVVAGASAVYSGVMAGLRLVQQAASGVGSYMSGS